MIKLYMPYLFKLYTDGVSGNLRSILPPLSPGAWTAIQTGIDPLEFNIYDFKIFNKRERKYKIVNADLLEGTIWEILSSVGKKVAAVNIPMTFPPKKVNGYIVSGLLTPSIESEFTYPSFMKDLILNKIPDYQVNYPESIKFLYNANDIKNFINQRKKDLKNRTEVCLNIIKNDDIDFLMVNFQANDLLQHILWGFLDKENKLYSIILRNFIFREFYRNLDGCIEKIRENFINKIGGDLLTIILSDHGFENHNKCFFLGDWLYKQGFLCLNSLERVRYIVLQTLSKIYQSNVVIKKIFDILLDFITTNKKKMRIEKSSITEFPINLINWKKSYVFSTGFEQFGLIFVLPEGEKRDKIIASLKKKLYNIKDPETKDSIIEKIYINENLESCNPDLLIKPKKGYSFLGRYYNKKKLFKSIALNKEYQIGKHSENGILIINHPNVTKTKITDASILDIVPTIFHFFGIPKSPKMKGKILKPIENL